MRESKCQSVMDNDLVWSEVNVAYCLHGNCYLNITHRCTLRCQFCPKHQRNWIVQDFDLSLPKEPDLDQVQVAIGDPAHYREVVFCGLGEPTQRLELLLDIASWIKRHGGAVRLNTDGLANLVYGRDVTPELARYVDKISVSLNAHNEEVYIRHTRPKRPGAYASMLEFVQCAKLQGIDVTVTAIDGLPDVNITACRLIAETLGVRFRRRVLDQVG